MSAARRCRSPCGSRSANCAAGLRGFYVFVACIALGVGAIAGVNSVSRALTDGIAVEGRDHPRRRRRLLAHPPRGRAGGARLPAQRRARVGTVATMRAMVRRPDERRPGAGRAEGGGRHLSAWRNAGRRTASGDGAGAAGARRDGVYGALAAPELLDRLGVAGRRHASGSGTATLPDPRRHPHASRTGSRAASASGRA